MKIKVFTNEYTSTVYKQNDLLYQRSDTGSFGPLVFSAILHVNMLLPWTCKVIIYCYMKYLLVNTVLANYSDDC